MKEINPDVCEIWVDFKKYNLVDIKRYYFAWPTFSTFPTFNFS